MNTAASGVAAEPPVPMMMRPPAPPDRRTLPPVESAMPPMLGIPPLPKGELPPVEMRPPLDVTTDPPVARAPPFERKPPVAIGPISDSGGGPQVIKAVARRTTARIRIGLLNPKETDREHRTCQNDKD